MVYGIVLITLDRYGDYDSELRHPVLNQAGHSWSATTRSTGTLLWLWTPSNPHARGRTKTLVIVHGARAQGRTKRSRTTWPSPKHHRKRPCGMCTAVYPEILGQISDCSEVIRLLVFFLSMKKTLKELQLVDVWVYGRFRLIVIMWYVCIV